jgi:hypothetical protein
MSTPVHNADVKSRLFALYDELIAHNGFGEMRVEVRLLKRGQKEVILHCGKQYRFVIDCPDVPGQQRRKEEPMV